MQGNIIYLEANSGTYINIFDLGEKRSEEENKKILDGMFLLIDNNELYELLECRKQLNNDGLFISLIEAEINRRNMQLDYKVPVT